MTKQTTSKAGEKRIYKIIAVVALLTLALITSLLVYLTYGHNSQPTAFFARSINDAAYDCEDKIDNRFGERLVSKYYDEFSSRYEADYHQYVIYYRVSAREEGDENFPGIDNYMAKCIVWEKLGYVSDFQVFTE